MEAPKKKRGRPKKMTESVKKQAILLFSTTTKSIRQVCKVLKINPSTFTLELANDTEFSAQYVRARAQQADLFFEEMLDIARRKSSDSVAATDKRTEIDTIKWMLSKMTPKKYGDRTQVQLQGQDPTEAPAPIIIKSDSNIDYDKLPIEVLDAIIAAKKKDE